MNANLHPRRVALWRRAARWMVTHPNLAVAAGIMLWLAVSVGVFGWALSAERSDGGTGSAAWWARQIVAWAGWGLVPLQILGLRLFRKYCDGDVEPDEGAKAAPLSLSSLKHRRIYEREPVRRELLPRFALLGVAGIGLGVLLSFWLAITVATTGDAGRSYRGLLVLLAALAILNPYCGVLALRDVILLWEEEDFIAGREEEVGAALMEETRRAAELEARRERDVQSLRGWPGLLLFGGFAGGILLTAKWLGETQSIVVFQSSAAALVGGAAWIYTTRLRPRHWRLVRVLTVAGAAGFLVFTLQSWGPHWFPMGLGVAWGGVAGVWGTLLYVRRLRR